MVSLWKWSSSNLTASRSEAPQWSSRPSLISSPTKHNTPPTRLNAGPSGAATFFPPHIITSPVLSCHGRCCWCRSHSPRPAWSLSGSQLSKYFSTACLVSMRLSEQCGTVCLWDCVYCNAFFLLMSADISLFECLFLSVVSICCLWTQLSSSEW